MKKLIILLIAALPLAVLAGGGDKDNGKTEKININIHTNKNGGIEITGLNDKDLKELQTKINSALKDVNVTIGDGKEKHKLHFKAQLNID